MDLSRYYIYLQGSSGNFTLSIKGSKDQIYQQNIERVKREGMLQLQIGLGNSRGYLYI